MSSSDELVEQLVSLLCASTLKLATAESCTGGMIGALCTSISGSSQWYVGGCVTYTNELKIKMLDVSADTLEEFGAVSVEVAAEMATGVARSCGADVSISTTGIAGPTGGTDAKPVGTVCIGCHVQGDTYASMFHFQGDRHSVRSQSVSKALEMCLELLRRNADAR